ncbi:beta-galactosidase [Paenibacillus yanchengensis]|uniref:Beta-galactosidase n=1 Tax=Paenibacillus yanchengensis TaxID=2035833 RepID=A0ABW4YET3_9BACL
MDKRTVIFYDPTFPITGDVLQQETWLALKDIGVVVDAQQLEEVLLQVQPHSFINLHAPYFPKTAWNTIVTRLKAGMGLLSLGGAPFKHPVRQAESGAWFIEAEQTAFHQSLGIHEVLKVKADAVTKLEALREIPVAANYLHVLDQQADVLNLVPHVTKSSDLPHEMGSAGPMDARVYPLVKGIGSDGRQLSAPIILWERVLGEFAGARWMFVGQPLTEAFWNNDGVAALTVWNQFVAAGVTEWWLKPNYATYEIGERPQLTLQVQRPGSDSTEGGQVEAAAWTATVTIEKDGESEPLYEHTVTLEANAELQIIRLTAPLNIENGYYRLQASLVSDLGETRHLRQGFWGRDDALLASGNVVTADRDYFRKDGRPLPIVGMTYMSSDVARKFLTLPNVAVWERDMEQMSKAGINWIRTGIWTAYRNVMEVDGHVSEAALRSIDAFLLTAKRHDLQVTFTFFSFTPETWEGRNPFLDPRSVEAQKRFIRSIVSRHRQTKNVDWDLINEPSMFDPARIFSGGPRTCNDPYEHAAYVAWLEAKHGAIEVLQEKWNMTTEQLPSFAQVKIPEPNEINFDIQDMAQAKKGGKWLDYVLFSMDMHNRWASQLYATIKEVCPDHMVTVGQDEGLGAQRPSPLFYEECVDYTTVHSWWLNDQLLWDSVFTKTPNKPNVIQETGMMYVETPDGRAKRSELELRNILERKYAYSFAAGGAGAVQWIWNTNFYMDNANESHIGALRADGTEKPEANVSYDFGKFMASIRDLFTGRELEDTVIVFPYSNDFSNRKVAFQATTQAVRTLAYQLKMPLRGIGEYQLEDLRTNKAKLIIVPSAHNFDNKAFEQLLDIVQETGATLLWSGPLSLDAYWRQTKRTEALVGSLQLHNVRREEKLILPDGTSLAASYGSRKIAELVKEITVTSDGKQQYSGDNVIEAQLGAGKLIWSPQPVELNERVETLEQLYRYALNKADVSPRMEWLQGGDLAGVYGEKVTLAEGSLYIFVSESGFDATIAVADPETGKQYSFELANDRSVLFATDKQGKLLAVYRPDEVMVHEHVWTN